MDRSDVRNLAQFFYWVEHAPDAKAIREWGFSNTTLEQVFLSLGEQSSTVNFTDHRTLTSREMCPMCRKRVRDSIVMRALENPNILMLLPDSVCSQCTVNPNFVIHSSDYSPLLFHQSVMTLNSSDEVSRQFLLNNLIREANRRQVLSGGRDYTLDEFMTLALDASKFPLITDISETKGESNNIMSNNSRLLVDNDIGAKETDQKDVHMKVADNDALNNETIARSHGMQDMKTDAGVKDLIVEDIETGSKETMKSIVPSRSNHTNNINDQVDEAPVNDDNNNNQNIINNNSCNNNRYANNIPVQKNKRKPISNDSLKNQIYAIMKKNVTLQSHQRCANCCVISWLVLMILSLYVLGFLFNSTNDYIHCVNGGYVTNVNLGKCSSDNLAKYLFNNPKYPYYFDWTNADGQIVNEEYTIKEYLAPIYYDPLTYMLYRSSQDVEIGFPYYSYRIPVIWSSYLNSTTKFFTNYGFSLYSMPKKLLKENLNSNDFILNEQNEIYQSTLRSKCDIYAPGYLLNITSYLKKKKNPLVSIQNYFAQHFADASFDCPNCFQSLSTPWNHSIYFDGTLWVANTDINDSGYPYAFIDITPSITEASVSTKYCPQNIQKLSFGPIYTFTNRTRLVMQYLNILSNSLSDPTLTNYTIQGGTSPYGVLDYTLNFAQDVAFILTIFVVVILNGFWPFTVWRLSYEWTSNIRLMMKAMGLRWVGPPIVFLSQLYLYLDLIE